jgi:low affinity Fe/Cu permease
MKKPFFTSIAERASCWSGSPAAFAIAFSAVVIWAATGPLFHFSDSWQIVINTTTTIITFLLVFLIQHSQTRDTKALHLKLDELLRATEGAHTIMMNLEKLSEDELDQIHAKYEALAKKAREKMRAGKNETGQMAISLEDNNQKILNETNESLPIKANSRRILP